MKDREKKLLESAESVVRLARYMPGSADPHARYNSKDPDSLGVLMEWYYRDAGRAIAGARFDRKRYQPR